MSKAPRKLLRIPQAVEYMGGVITAATLRQWIWLRKIETVRLGRVVCIPVEALDEVIERGTMPALEVGDGGRSVGTRCPRHSTHGTDPSDSPGIRVDS